MTMQSETSTDITRIILFVSVIGALLLGSFWILLPFLSGLAWATTIAVATWPALLRLQGLTGGRRRAAAIMTLLVLVAFIAPFAVALGILLDAAQRSPALMSDFLARGLDTPPPWVAEVPWVGRALADKWETLAAGGPEALVALVQPYARSTAGTVIAATGGVGRMVALGLVTVVLVGILYAKGEVAASGAVALARRLGGDTGERALILAGQAIRGVALGVVVTALVQSVLAGIGLWICGVPHPAVLMAIAFVLGIAQIGPIPLMALSIGWLYWTGAATWATALLIWTIPVGTLDNVLRPMLIRRGVQLPLLLIVAGVIGGLISFGVIGLFVGPVLLAITYTLAKEWVAGDESSSW